MENSDSTSISKMEKQKWLIEKIDQIHKSLIESYESLAKKYENDGNKGLSKLKERRTVGTSALGGTLTILLAINSKYNMEIWSFLSILISLIIAVVIYFILLTKIIGILERVLDDIDSIIQKGIGELGFSQGYFLSHVANIEKIDYDFVQNYFICLMLLLGSVMAYTGNEFQKIIPRYRQFRDLKNNLKNEVKEYETYRVLMPQYYENFDSKKDIPKTLLEFIHKNLKDDIKKKESSPVPLTDQQTDDFNSKYNQNLDEVSTTRFRSSAKFVLCLGIIPLFAGIIIFLGCKAGTMEEKIGLVLFTCGALFVGASYTLFVAYKQEKIKG